MSITKKVVVFGFVGLVTFNLFAQVMRPTKDDILSVSNIVSESVVVMEAREIWLNEVSKGIWLDRCWNAIRNKKYNADEKVEIDKAFGEANVGSPFIEFPICFTNFVNRRFSNDHRREMCYRYKSWYWPDFSPVPTLEDMMFLFQNDVWHSKSLHFYQVWQKMIVKSYINELKRYLRKQGKSIVVKDGVNPLQPYIERMVAALNSPKMNGLNGCFAEINRSDIMFDFNEVMTDEQIEALKERFLNGSIRQADMNAAKMQLFVALGVNGYNELVRQYNGD